MTEVDPMTAASEAAHPRDHRYAASERRHSLVIAWRTRADRWMVRSAASVGCALLLTSALPVQAQTEVGGTADVVTTAAADAPREQTYETARGLGMGLGARASAQGTSALSYNTANLGLGQLYHIETMASFIPGDRAWAYGGAIVDSMTSKVAAGLSFHGFHGSGDRALRGYDGRLGLGIALSDKIGIGIAGRYMSLRSRRENAAGESIGAGVKAFTLDAAIRVSPFTGFHIAALGSNLIPTDSPLAPMLLGGSASYGYEAVFAVAVDVMVDLKTFAEPELLIGVGVEYLAGESFPLRVGYRRDQGRSLHQVTAAVGYVDPRFGIDMALRQDVGAVDNDTQLLLNLRYHVQ